MLICIVTALIYILASSEQGSLFPTSLSTVSWFCFVNHGHSDRDEMRSQCSFDCISLMAMDVKYFFHVFIYHFDFFI
jgi:hypothetical protein